MKTMLLILMTLASVAYAGVLRHHSDDCYVSSNRCKLYDSSISVQVGEFSFPVN
jgi:hypothetical protein